MGSSKKPLFLISLTIFAFFFNPLIATDNTNLVFKGCAAQKFQDPSGSQNLKVALATLVSQSAEKNFSTTTTGDGQNAIMGLYQCRGDLTNTQCYDCVSKISGVASKLCGKAIAARVQLSGCYLKYEVVGFNQVSETELLYRVCGSTRASGTGFDGKRETAFDMATDGIKSGGLFYTGTYESVYVLGQCEGDLASGDCVDCVKSAFERAKSECGDSVSAQLYLNKCYISYTYYPNGVPSVSSASGTRQHTQRTVAIAVGGVAALGLLIVILMFIRSLMKKKSRSSSGKHGGWN
ncbi:Stress-antifung domain-containing protein [Cephalotus follicularis]|uniref:Stress-antifung domain-containing protein n=1 Tax=Cephalotus follicularis TaxID=3775 RepID=A0A1Q3CSL9_CEPFO|nr:Stress-antifung domain-containing protein [Cephalotus follicularis]